MNDRSREPASDATAPGLARRASLTGLGTLVSRLLGLVRDAVIAAAFSLRSVDAFLVAFTIPNALRGLFAEGAASAAVVPLYTEARSEGGDAEARRFFGGFAVAMGIVLVAVSAVGVVAAEPLVRAYAGGYVDDPERFALTVQLTRVVLPYIGLVGLASVATGVLHVHGRFAVAGVAPAMLNVALIAAALLLAEPLRRVGLPPVMSLAMGALAGGAAHCLLLAWELGRAGVGAARTLGFRDPRVRRGFRLLAPLVAGVGVYQLNVLLSRRFASFLPVGAQSYLYFSHRLVELPQGMVALAVASAALPALAAQSRAGDEAAARRTHGAAIALVLFLAVPATVLMVVAAEPIVAVLFGRGRFGPDAVRATADALVAMAAGVIPVAVVRTTVPAFHARQETRAPVLAAVVNVVAFATLAPALMEPLAHVGIAAAISLAAFLQLVVLALLLARRGAAPPLSPILVSLARALVASAAAGAVAWLCTRGGVWEQGARDLGNVLRLVGGLLVAGVAYALTAWLLRAPEMGRLVALWRRRRSGPS